MSAKPPVAVERIRLQLTLDAQVHEHLVMVLAPLNRWKRKERLTLLIYAGLDMEVIRNGIHLANPVRRHAGDAGDVPAPNGGWKPQIEGDALEELGLKP
jgi:hypothetical protein